VLIDNGYDLNKGLTHLGKDDRLRALIDKYGKPEVSPKKDYFHSLLRSIVFQQLSGRAANTIYDRFVKLIPEDASLTPAKILKLRAEDMREAGLSFQKLNYIRNLAKFFIKSPLAPEDAEKMTNHEISQVLTSVKGIGQWTADMFMIFTLNRPDVLPYTDLGIQKGFKNIFGLTTLPSKIEMSALSEPWKPYRSLACWYLWRVVDDGFTWQT
jgi:DNA-3-methyladenine glycosylase II